MSNLQLVPVDNSEVSEKSNFQVPKVRISFTIVFVFRSAFGIKYNDIMGIFCTLQAVEKVLAGSIRREMALEEFCTKQASEISQLNRLV